MKASELIQQMKDHVKRHGDLDVHSTGGAVEIIEVQRNGLTGVNEYILSDKPTQRIHAFQRFPVADE